MNFGIIGLNWGRNYIKNINFLQHNIIALCCRGQMTYIDLNIVPDSPEYYVTSAYSVLCSDDKIDTIIVATPPKYHYEMVKCALLNNKHVICEKPFVFDVDQALELKELSIKNKRNLIIGFQHLWNPDYKKLFKIQPWPLNQINTIINMSTGNKKRVDYSFWQDYGPHDLSMVLNFIGLDAELKDFKIDKNDETGYFINLYFDKYEVRNIFQFKEEKFRAFELFNLDKEDTLGSLIDMFVDIGSHNSLRIMLQDFIDKTKNNEYYSNIDLAIKTTEILNKVGI